MPAGVGRLVVEVGALLATADEVQPASVIEKPPSDLSMSSWKTVAALATLAEASSGRRPSDKRFKDFKIGGRLRVFGFILSSFYGWCGEFQANPEDRSLCSGDRKASNPESVPASRFRKNASNYFSPSRNCMWWRFAFDARATMIVRFILRIFGSRDEIRTGSPGENGIHNSRRRRRSGRR